MEDRELYGTRVIVTDQHVAVLTKASIGAIDLRDIAFKVAI
jgi:hypothetical protein